MKRLAFSPSIDGISRFTMRVAFRVDREMLVEAGAQLVWKTLVDAMAEPENGSALASEAAAGLTRKTVLQSLQNRLRGTGYSSPLLMDDDLGELAIGAARPIVLELFPEVAP